MNQHSWVAGTPIPFIDVGAQRQRLGTRIDAAIAGVLEHCQFILGPEVARFEDKLADFCGAAHAISTASGTDALLMVLLAKGIGQGDAVLCPAFTFCASAEAIALAGATPVFVDIAEDTFNLQPASLVAGIRTASRRGLQPKAVIAVDLFGITADYDAIAAAAGDLLIIADAAQSFGATYKQRRVGTLAPATATSFFPAKPLGCYGDGGAVLTDDAELAKMLRSLRVHGQGASRDNSVRIGLTSRLDTLQAAILIEKLKIFPDEIAARDRIARRYQSGLKGVTITPSVPDGCSSVWSQFTLRIDPGRRSLLRASLQAQGIPTAVYYPRPLHQQDAYRHFPVAEGGAPVAERVASQVVSLPMHAYLQEAVQDRIIAAVCGGHLG
jgi:UDP-2-acetamido-2-deoxy-ribo-hexuluronate aminotransferase